MALQTIKTGQSLPITKSDGSALTRFRLELSWNNSGVKAPYDFDVAAIETTGGSPGASLGKGVEEARVCYFGQKNTPAAKLDKDNRTGDGEGPDETIIFDLTKVHSTTNMIPAIVTLYEGVSKGQDFSQTKGAKCVLVDDQTGEKLFEANLDNMPAGTTAAVFATVNKGIDGSWRFTAVNQGFVGKGIADFFSLLGF